MLPLLALQDYAPAAIDEHILWTYPQLMTRLLESLADLPAGDVTVVGYDDLLHDPLGTVRRIYRDLALGDPGNGAAAAMATAAAGQRHRTPSTTPLDPQTAARLASRWEGVADRLGYQLEVARGAGLV
jgi:hypothetical protein